MGINVTLENLVKRHHELEDLISARQQDAANQANAPDANKRLQNCSKN